MAMFKLGENDPGGEDAKDRNAKVETNADEVVGAALGLHANRYCQKMVKIWRKRALTPMQLFAQGLRSP